MEILIDETQSPHNGSYSDEEFGRVLDRYTAEHDDQFSENEARVLWGYLTKNRIMSWNRDTSPPVVKLDIIGSFDFYVWDMLLI